MNEDPRFAAAAARFEAAHREDPRTVTRDGREVPWSVLYHARLAHWVERLDPGASEALRLAARCQHLRRWRLPRADHPMTPEGYKRWRAALARFHAEEAGRILGEAGYDAATIDRVGALLLKKGLRKDAEVQRFEDAICLVFLENELAEFAARHEDAKVVDILRKTWAKMSPAGHAAALELAATLPPGARRLVEEAVAAPGAR
jgi:hypothetical protein